MPDAAIESRAEQASSALSLDPTGLRLDLDARVPTARDRAARQDAERGAPAFAAGDEHAEGSELAAVDAELVAMSRSLWAADVSVDEPAESYTEALSEERDEIVALDRPTLNITYVDVAGARHWPDRFDG